MFSQTAASTGQLTGLDALFIIVMALLLTVSQSYINALRSIRWWNKQKNTVWSTKW